MRTAIDKRKAALPIGARGRLVGGFLAATAIRGCRSALWSVALAKEKPPRRRTGVASWLAIKAAAPAIEGFRARGWPGAPSKESRPGGTRGGLGCVQTAATPLAGLPRQPNADLDADGYKREAAQVERRRLVEHECQSADMQLTAGGGLTPPPSSTPPSRTTT
jgi:hypothetical protein